MTVRASKFIDLLESQELLSPEVIEELRRQLRESGARLKPELIAKLLVDNGHLTKFQATKLVSSLSQEAEEPEPTPKPADTSSNRASVNDELTFADEADEPVSRKAAKQSREPAEPVAQVFLEDEAPLIDQVEAVEVVADDGDADVIQAVEVVEPGATSGPLDAVEETIPSIAKPVRPKVAKSNPWDSFRILGVGLLLALVLIAGFFLVNYFIRGNAEDRLNMANEAYEQRSYETAATMYEDFAKTWPSNENASFARVRSALAKIRESAEGAPDPALGLQTALETLPTVADEAGLSDQRDDLAGVLISLAAKFNERAAGRSTDERKQLMDQMAELLSLIDDPQFVGQAQRNQQRPTLDKIDEDRSRILREIYRDEELQRALAEIDAKLQEQDTDSAYSIRSKLINSYPILEANDALQQRVLEASRIQTSLVKPGTLSPTLGTESPDQTLGNSFVLGHRYGQRAAGLEGETLFAKVKGSVYGLDGATGNVLWRHYVGREFDTQPIRVGEAASAGVLICQPEKGHLLRVDGVTGKTQWFVDFGTPIHQPVVEGADLLVATLDGEIASLDVEGGQVLWNQKLPQPVEVGPCLAFGKPNLYIPGQHSNLYVLSRSDGSCREVFYLGHRAGSIRVPPVLLLGQVFVFENSTASNARIRILTTSEDGLQLAQSQVPLPVEGNVVVPPQVDGRRLIVQSDLGQLLVLDVEPTAETDKVNLIASRAKNVLTPQLSWLATANNKLWVADTRLTRFDLQVSMGRLNSSWSRHDGDRFTAPPKLFDKVIVHSRSLRGNRGIRVAAADADTGDTFWEIDLGVPVTLLHQTAENRIDALNSGGMLFQLNKDRFRSQADSNPGQGKRTMDFSLPLEIDETHRVLMNASRSNQLAYYDATRGDLRIVSANFGGGLPSCEPVAVEDKLAVGLDNGQFVLLDPSNGSLASSPYQPPMEAGKKIRWNRPAYLSSSKTIFASSDLQKLVRLALSGSSLRALTEVDLETPLKGPIISLGNHIAAVNSTLSGDALTIFDSTSLKVLQSVPLDGNLVAGPFAMETGCLVQTDSRILALTPEGKQQWSLPMTRAKLVGAPLVGNNQLILATQTGEILVVDAGTGEVSGRIATGQPFSSRPLVLPAGLLVGSDEGTVLALPVPTQVDTAGGSQ